MFNTNFFFNKIQLKIYIFILLGRTRFNSFESNCSNRNSGACSIIQGIKPMNSGACSTVHGIKRNKTHEQWSHTPLFIRFIPYKKQLLAASCKPVAHQSYKWVPWKLLFLPYQTLIVVAAVNLTRSHNTKHLLIAELVFHDENDFSCTVLGNDV